MSTDSQSQTQSQPVANNEPCEYGYLAGSPTTLRCAKCTRPLLVKDARQTPVGYVCPNYVKGRVSASYNAAPQHYVVAGVIALVMGVVAGFALSLVSGVGFFGFLIMTFVAPTAGGIIAEAIRISLKKMGKVRGQYIWLVAAICVGVGTAPFLLGLFLRRGFDLFGIGILLYGLAVTIATLIARLRI